MQGYKDLIAWKKSIELVKEVYKVIALLPNCEQFALCSQMRRSAISIPSNIAEGYGRGSRKEYVRFLYVSKGSAYELETQLILCEELGYINYERIGKSLELCNEAERLINSLINKFEKDLL